MTSYMRLRGPQVTLERRRKDCWKTIWPRNWGLLPTLTFMFLFIAFFSVGLFVLIEIKVTQRLKILEKRRQAPLVRNVPPVTIAQGDFFKIYHLLNASAPNVELSTQLILNRLYSTYNRNDILNYYNSVRCRGENGLRTCKDFTIVSKSANRTRWESLKPCKAYPERLRGRRYVWNNKFLPIEKMEKEFLTAIRPGGWWEPQDCLARHSIAIVIPYKDRWSHLTTLLNYLHPLLQRQEIRYKLFVVEQYNNGTFNKGVLMNAAFLEALKEELFHCFIFHDVDLIPESDYNMYSCPQMPRHMSMAVNEFNYKLPYYLLVGGAFAIRTEHFFKVNGYSNLYWGWGAEDDDMGLRVVQSGLKITRPVLSMSRYTMIKHLKRKNKQDLKMRLSLLATTRKRYRLEGLNSVQYTLIGKKAYPWYTNILVDVGRPYPVPGLRRG